MAANKEQQQAITSKSDRILCLAGAGAGKSYTLLERISNLVDSGVLPSSILALTFTNAAGAEMRERYERTHVGQLTPQFRTFHSFCYSIVCRDPAIRSGLGYDTIPNIASESEEKEITERAKAQCNICLSADQLAHREDLSKKEQFQAELFDKAVYRLLRQDNLITFDKLNSEVADLFAADHISTKPYKQQYKYIFVDEFQDTDQYQIKFLNSFPNTNFFFVGDCLQCQPAGTLVTMSDLSTKPIEELKIGDKVLTYCADDGYYVKKSKRVGDLYTKRILAISQHYATNVVRVSTANHSSRYTKDHITYAKIHFDGNEDSFVTYLMSNDRGWWRVGSTKLFLSKSGVEFGPRSRLNGERGNRVWILGVYSNANDAWINEQSVAYKYGIPQITWCHENVRYNIEDLDYLYKQLGDLTDKAKICLAAYDRDILYPLCTRGDVHNHFSKLHYFQCRVGNLIPGIFDIVIPYMKPGWHDYCSLSNGYEMVTSIEPQPDQIVYGLDVEMNHNYVSDGILTHNCIYQFRGASNEYIKALSNSPGWEKIKLFTNYRSTNQICEFANSFSQSYANDSYRIEMKGTRDGEKVVTKVVDGPSRYDAINTDSIDDVLKELENLSGTTAILCRTNKENNEITSYLKKKGIEYTSSRDARVLHIVEAAVSDKYMIGWLASYLTSDKYGEYIRLSVQHPEDVNWFLRTYGSNAKISKDATKITTLRKISTDPLPIEKKIKDAEKLLKLQSIEVPDKDLFGLEFLEYIKTQAEEIKSSELYVGTIHSVKGLEYDNVFVMNVNSYCFKIHRNEEMSNLYYVACTRAKNRLFIYKIASWYANF